MERFAMVDIDPWIGKRLGKYRIVRAIGKGGMGMVYEAEDARLQRPVALKLLPEHMARAELVLKRFLLEGRAAARLSHPNVVAVYDIGQRGTTYYLAMELLRGTNLQKVLNARGPLPWAHATWVCAEVCRGLVAAHAAGLIHRDIKPSNILLAGFTEQESAGKEQATLAAGAWPANPIIKIADFGLAKLLAQSFPRLTTLNSTVGTPAYMSPEQCRGEPVDALSDVYALGSTYFTLLTGRPPFGDRDDFELLEAHCSTPTPDPRQFRPDIPPPCAAIVLRAMTKERSQRFHSAAEMLDALTAAMVAGHRTGPPAVSTDTVGAVHLQAPTRLMPAAAHRPWWKRWWPLALVFPILIVPLLLSTGLSTFFSRNGNEPGTGNPKSRGPANEGKKPLIADAVKLRPTRKLTAHQQSIAGLAFSRYGDRLASGAGPSIVVWDTVTGERVHFIEHLPSVTALAFIPGTAKLAVATDDRIVAFWPRDKGTELGRFGPLNADVVSMAASPDGKLLALGTGSDLQVWDVSASPRKTFVYPRSQHKVAGVAFSGDGQSLAWVNFQGEIHVVEVGNWKSAAQSSQKPGEFSCVTFTPDGKSVIYGGRGEPGRGVLKHWEFARFGANPRTIPSDSEVRALGLLPGGGNLLYGGGWGGPLRLLDLQEEKSRPAASVGQTALVRLAMPTNGRTVAGGMESGGVQLWEVVPDTAKAPAN